VTKIARHLLALILSVLVFAPAAAHALSVSVALDGLLGEYPLGGETRVVEWDVGVAFAEIEDITLRVVMGDASVGICTASVLSECTGTSVLSSRVYTTSENRPPFASQSPFRGSNLSNETRPRAPLGDIVGQNTSGTLVLHLPDYTPFLDGRGLLEVEFALLGDIGTDGSPGTITSAQLTVVGTPVPEPATVLLLLVGLASAAVVARAGRLRG
jgi:hypothetical protein